MENGRFELRHVETNPLKWQLPVPGNNFGPILITGILLEHE
jgi:hypothetical protein